MFLSKAYAFGKDNVNNAPDCDGIDISTPTGGAITTDTDPTDITVTLKVKYNNPKVYLPVAKEFVVWISGPGDYGDWIYNANEYNSDGNDQERRFMVQSYPPDSTYNMLQLKRTDFGIGKNWNFQNPDWPCAYNCDHPHPYARRFDVPGDYTFTIATVGQGGEQAVCKQTTKVVNAYKYSLACKANVVMTDSSSNVLPSNHELSIGGKVFPSEPGGIGIPVGMATDVPRLMLDFAGVSKGGVSWDNLDWFVVHIVAHWFGISIDNRDWDWNRYFKVTLVPYDSTDKKTLQLENDSHALIQSDFQKARFSVDYYIETWDSNNNFLKNGIEFFGGGSSIKTRDQSTLTPGKYWVTVTTKNQTHLDGGLPGPFSILFAPITLAGNIAGILGHDSNYWFPLCYTLIDIRNPNEPTPTPDTGPVCGADLQAGCSTTSGKDYQGTCCPNFTCVGGNTTAGVTTGGTCYSSDSLSAFVFGANYNSNIGGPNYTPMPLPSPACDVDASGNYTCQTAVGNINTSPDKFIQTLMGIILSIAGGIAIILIIISGYRLMVSQGNPENIKNAKDQLTAAIVGLLFIIFSLVVLQIIGYNILGLPGFNQ